MKPGNHEYHISGSRLILPGIILVLFTALFLCGFLISYRISLIKSLLLIIPPAIILAASLPRYLRLLSLALNHKPALILSPRALVDQIHRKNYAWTDIGEISYRPGGGKSTGSRVIVVLRNGRHIELPHKLMGCTHTELIQSLQTCLRDFGQNTPDPNEIRAADTTFKRDLPCPRGFPIPAMQEL